jgi:acyl carrier protein
MAAGELEIRNELNTLFQKVFRIKDLEINPDWSASNIDGWDSLNHMKLIAEIEAHFQLAFSYREVKGLTTISDLIQLVLKHKN